MQVEEISESLKQQLLGVKPSRFWAMEYRPCQVKLQNGEIIDRVYVAEVDTYMEIWGVLPDEDTGKKYIVIEEVAEILESPTRMPVALANKLYEAGESGMGYCLYQMKLDNGQMIDVLSGNAVDFPPIPNGLTTQNIKEVFPHQGSRKNYTDSPDYTWCLFKGEMPELKNNTGKTATNHGHKAKEAELKNKQGFWSKLKSRWS